MSDGYAYVMFIMVNYVGNNVNNLFVEGLISIKSSMALFIIKK